MKVAFAGTPIAESASPEGEERSERPLSFLLSARNRFVDLTVRVETVDGEMFWSLTGKPHFDAADQFQGYRGSAKDITAQVERQRDASRLAQFDSLTGLANRHRMATRLATLLTTLRAARRSCARSSVTSRPPKLAMPARSWASCTPLTPPPVDTTRAAAQAG